MTKALKRAAVAAALLALTACGGSADPAPAPTRADDRFYDRYVALGDSYTAAPLVGASSVDDPCIQSDVDYPHLLARYLGATLIDQSCTGADLSNVVGRQLRLDDEAAPPQIEAVTAQTDLVTVGIGGNPAAAHAWFEICPALRDGDPEGSPCRDHFREEGGGTDALARVLRKQRKQLVTVLTEIRERAPEARVFVVGYPAIFPEKGHCPKRLTLAKGDVAYARATLHRLNDHLEHAAEKTGAEYVDVYAATVGHDICSDDPWIQGRKSEVGVGLAYHPKAEEQRAVADLLLRQLR